MKTFAFLVVALCALSSAHARDLKAAEGVDNTAFVGGYNTPVEMVLSKSFLAKAEAAAVSAHKLPYSNPFTGMCMPSEMKVSISGIPGKEGGKCQRVLERIIMSDTTFFPPSPHPPLKRVFVIFRSDPLSCV